MTITTYQTFMERLRELAVDDVVTNLQMPPESVVPGDLPVLYVENISGEEGPLTAKFHGGWPTLTADLIVLVQAVELGTRLGNYEKTINMLDNVSSALRGIPVRDAGGTNDLEVGRGPVRWSISYDPQFVVGPSAFWAVVATITANG